MAIAKNGILGGFSGSVGDIIGSTWKGKTTIRSKSEIERKPLTQKQKEALSLSKLVLDVYPNMQKYILPHLLHSNELGMTPMNVFQRTQREAVKNLVYKGVKMPILDRNPKKIINNTLFPLDTGSGTYVPFWEITDEVQSMYYTKRLDFTALQFRRENGLYRLYAKFEMLNVPVSRGYFEPVIEHDCQHLDGWYYLFVIHEIGSTIPDATQQWSGVSYD